MTGAAWVSIAMFSRDEVNPSAAAARPWLMKLHGGFAVILLVVLGTLIPLHIRRGWHNRMNRRTGGSLVAIFTLLIATGYALYYLDSEGPRQAASEMHWIVGLVLPVLMAVHIWAGRRGRDQP
jgi:heme A synthase